MREQRRFVRQQPVEAAIERILLDQRIVGAEQVRHRGLLEPQPVQTPFAAGIDQPVAHQRLQDAGCAANACLRASPASAAPRTNQARAAHTTDTQASMRPIAAADELHAIKPHLHAMALRMLRNRAIGGKQRQLPMTASVFVKRLNHPTPGFTLAVVDLAEIQHLALHHLPGHAAAVLDNIPVPMFLAVLEASVEAQKHDANQVTPTQIGAKDTWSTLQTIHHQTPLFRLPFSPRHPEKITVRQPQLRKLG